MPSIVRDHWNRRRFLMIASAGWAVVPRLEAFATDFWNKKDPAEWTGAEKDELTNKSPWAKGVTVSSQGPMGGMGRGGMGYPMGYPMGIPGMGGGRRAGAQGQSYRGVVRWESAQPVRDALKEPLPEGFEKMYVISVGGIPLNAGNRSSSQSQYPSQYPSQTQDDNSQQDPHVLDRIKGLTLLEPKDKRYLQPALVVQEPAGYGNVYFGFAKDIVTIRPEDKEVGFSTQFGSAQIRAKFYLKDMLYHGELAV